MNKQKYTQVEPAKIVNVDVKSNFAFINTKMNSKSYR